VAQAASDVAAAAIRASLTMALVLGITNFSLRFIGAAKIGSGPFEPELKTVPDRKHKTFT
jgi:hypothetical protein